MGVLAAGPRDSIVAMSSYVTKAVSQIGFLFWIFGRRYCAGVSKRRATHQRLKNLELHLSAEREKTTKMGPESRI